MASKTKADTHATQRGVRLYSDAPGSYRWIEADLPDGATALAELFNAL
jgi:hypothetical protein